MMTQTIGRKLRQFRQKKGYSQETLADRAGLHPTYIGQVERGEKNITVETLAKITTALGIPISSVFDDVLSNPMPSAENYPLRAYELFSSLSEKDQRRLYDILSQIRSLLQLHLARTSPPPLPRRTAFFTAGFSIALSK